MMTTVVVWGVKNQEPGKGYLMVFRAKAAVMNEWVGGRKTCETSRY
jgi:hypothetical protein